MAGARSLAAVIAQRLRAQPPRAGSLAITIFGDAIAEQGNSVWLGSLVAAMQHFGLNPRQIRTAIFRLGRDGWLAASQRGRRRFYGYTEFARRQYARAAARIYAASAPPWDGRWTLVTAAGLAAPARDELRKRLGWLGFGAIAQGVLAHPQAQAEALHDTLTELGVADQVVVWQASAPALAPVVNMVGACWRLEAIAERYRGFIADFSAAVPILAGGAAIEHCEAFVLRTLLVHEYRRILLGSAELPAELLPPDWPGHAAMQLAATLYRGLDAAATAYCCAAMQNEAGGLPAPARSGRARFGAGDGPP